MNAAATLDSPPPVRRAPIALWRIAAAFMQTLEMIFGLPKDVAAEGGLNARAHKQLASWLACAEALLRRLLLIEAAALPPLATRPRLRAPRQRTRRQREFWADKPQEWRVSFRCFPALPKLGARNLRSRNRGAVSARSQNQTLRNAWPLAERYEAVFRVVENPEPYARRLARRLRANPQSASKLLHAPPEARERIDHFDDVTEAAARDRDTFCDTS